MQLWSSGHVSINFVVWQDVFDVPHNTEGISSQADQDPQGASDDKHERHASPGTSANQPTECDCQATSRHHGWFEDAIGKHACMHAAWQLER